MLVLLAACAAPSALTEIEASDAAAVLELDSVLDAPHLVRARDPELRLRAEGPVVRIREGAGEPAAAALVVEGDELAPWRVAVDDDGLRLLLWLAEADLVPVIAEDLWLDGAGRRVDDDEAGVYARAGFEVGFDGRWHGRHADLDALPHRVDPGWVDFIYRQGPWMDLPAGDSVAIAPGAELTDDAGRVLARVETWGATGRVIAEDPDDGAHLVQTDGMGPVRGWVDAEAIGTARWARFRCGTGLGWGWDLDFEPLAYIAAGTPLYDGPDGELVGIAYGGETHSVVDEQPTAEGRVGFLVDTPWGEVPVWAEPGEAPAADLHAAFGEG